MSTKKSPSKPRSSSPKKEGRASPFVSLIYIIIIAALVPVAIGGWEGLYRQYLEIRPPEISIVEAPRGIGMTPVTIRIRVSDENSGLRHVTARTEQKGEKKILVDQALEGKATVELNLQFEGEKSNLEEGSASIEIEAAVRRVIAQMHNLAGLVHVVDKK